MHESVVNYLNQIWKNRKWVLGHTSKRGGLYDGEMAENRTYEIYNAQGDFDYKTDQLEEPAHINSRHLSALKGNIPKWSKLEWEFSDKATWWVFNNTLYPHASVNPYKRLYLNVKSAHSVLVMEKILQLTVAAGAKDKIAENYRSKIISAKVYADEPGMAKRSDGILIYIGDTCKKEDIEQIITAVYVKEHFNAAIPAMTKELRPGFSRGLEPQKKQHQVGYSFGEVRSRLAGRALVELATGLDYENGSNKTLKLADFSDMTPACGAILPVGGKDILERLPDGAFEDYKKRVELLFRKYEVDPESPWTATGKPAKKK